MEAVILAGGMGTRLRDVVSGIPKPMAPVNGVPFLKILLDRLAENQISKIVLAAGYLADSIIRFFGDNYRNIPVVYSVEETPLGTGGAVKKALSHCLGEQVFVLNGDTFFNVSFSAMQRLHEREKADVTIASAVLEKPYRYGTLTVDRNKVCGFCEKREIESGLINCGVYLLNRNLLDGMPAVFSFERFLEENAGKLNIRHIPFKGRFIDIGIPEDYARAQIMLRKYTGNGKCRTEKNAEAGKALFLDRDGVINADTGHPHKPEEINFTDGIFEFVRLFNESGWKVIVVTNQAGVAKGYYSEDDVVSLHGWMARRFEEKGARIDRFYYCPHHPDGLGKYRKSCDCRKPGTGMVLRAQKDFSLDLSASVLIGDKDTDIRCAESAGVRALKFSGNKIDAARLFETIIKGGTPE